MDAVIVTFLQGISVAHDSYQVGIACRAAWDIALLSMAIANRYRNQ
jgi:hypothetical protein